MLSVWNPFTSKFIRLPPLYLKEGDIDEYFLSSPPVDRGSILLLTRKEKPTFFCRLDRKRERLRWMEMSYAKQLKDITGRYDECVYSLTCCNGKVYALNRGFRCVQFIIEVDIVVNEEIAVIRLLPFVKLPIRKHPSGPVHDYKPPILKASCSGLFVIYQFMNQKVFCSTQMVKLDMTRKLWDDKEELDDGICFFGLVNDVPFVASELGGGYIHMFCQEDK